MKKFILSGLICSRELLTTRALASCNAFQKYSLNTFSRFGETSQQAQIAKLFHSRKKLTLSPVKKSLFFRTQLSNRSGLVNCL